MAKNVIQIPQTRGALYFIKKQQKLGYLDDKPTVYGVQMLRGAVIGHDDIVAYAAKAANCPANDVDVALEALLDAITYFVVNGHSVQIPGLGTLGVTMRAKVMERLEDATSDSIRGVFMRFWPSQQMRELCSLGNVSTTLVDLKTGEGLTPGEDVTPDPDPEP